MKYNLPGAFALSAALIPGSANAIGFGEMALHSRIGEPLRAEVPVIANAGENVDGACFSVSKVPHTDLPTVTAIKIRLIQRDHRYYLELVGAQSIAEPIFMVGLQTSCGHQLFREFTLMPEAPLALSGAASATPPAPPQQAKKPRLLREVRAKFGQTLADIAVQEAPNDAEEQQRLATAMQRANPDIAPNQPIPEGTSIRLPRRPQAAPIPRVTKNAVTSRLAKSTPAPRKTPAPIPAPISPPPASVKSDRLILGSAPAEAVPQLKSSSFPDAQTEAKERISKLETTLQTLKEEMAKMDSALQLATESLIAQQRLQMAESRAAKAIASATLTAVPQADTSNGSHWLELILSALLGGGISAALIHLFTRRANTRKGESTAKSGQSSLVLTQQDVAESGPAILPTHARQNNATAVHTKSEEAEEFPSSPSRTPSIELRYDDDNAVLNLAEIMLAYGRLEGATETLAAHIEETSPDNFLPWRMLLDLYHRSNLRADFENLSAKIRTRFNVQVPNWEQGTPPASGLMSLESFPHVISHITDNWGTQDCLNYLHDLAHNTRTGQRSGFPLEVVEEIALLMRILEDAYGAKRTG